jgi:hypothetical protein
VQSGDAAARREYAGPDVDFPFFDAMLAEVGRSYEEAIRRAHPMEKA